MQTYMPAQVFDVGDIVRLIHPREFSMTSEKYVCMLTKESLAKAEEELNEKPEERLGAVDTFRQWILLQPHLKCPTDTGYLLRFMRRCHFSQLEARSVLEKFLINKTQEPQWLTNLDTWEKGIQAFLKTRYLVPLPGYSDKGRKIILYREALINPDKKEYDEDTVVRASFILIYYLSLDENVQVNGFEFLSDLTGLTNKQASFMSMDSTKRLLKIWQGAFPGRFKNYHIYNMGPVFEVAWAIIKPFLSKKMTERLVAHGSNMESVYKMIPMRMLPDEYLPDDYKGPRAGSADKLSEELTKQLSSAEVRNSILEETKAEYGADISKKPKDEPQASFRRLAVD